MSRKKKFDPLKILQEIASNTQCGDTARVAAARAILAHKNATSDDKPTGKDAPPTDIVTQKALRLLRGGKQ